MSSPSDARAREAAAIHSNEIHSMGDLSDLLAAHAAAEVALALDEVAAVGSPDDWWFPERANAAHLARLRLDHPEDTGGLDDEELLDQYGGGRKYSVTWDHVGDAYDEYEKLADAFFAIRALAAQHRETEA